MGGTRLDGSVDPQSVVTPQDGGSPASVTVPGFVATLAVAMGIGPLLIYGLSAAGPLVIADLGLTRAQFGSFATVAFAAAAISSGVFARFVDVHSERRTMSALFVGSAVALALAALAGSYWALIVAVVFSGCVQSLSNPVTNRLVSSYATAATRGILMGLKQSGVQMAQVAAGLAVPALALLVGWRGGLGIATVFAAAGLLLTWRYIPRRPVRGGAGRVPASARSIPPAVWWLTAYALLTGAALQASNVYLPLYAFEEVGLPVGQAGLTAAVVGAVGLVARIFWGRTANLLHSPHLPLLVLAIMAAGAVACIECADRVDATWLLWIGAAIFGATGIAANVVLMVAVLRVSPPEVIGRSSAVLAIGLYVGFAAGPVCFGAVVDATHQYQVGWTAVLSTYLAAVLLVLVGRNGIRPASGTQATPIN